MKPQIAMGLTHALAKLNFVQLSQQFMFNHQQVYQS